MKKTLLCNYPQRLDCQIPNIIQAITCNQHQGKITHVFILFLGIARLLWRGGLSFIVDQAMAEYYNRILGNIGVVKCKNGHPFKCNEACRSQVKNGENGRSKMEYELK